MGILFIDGEVTISQEPRVNVMIFKFLCKGTNQVTVATWTIQIEKNKEEVGSVFGLCTVVMCVIRTKIVCSQLSSILYKLLNISHCNERYKSVYSYFSVSVYNAT